MKVGDPGSFGTQLKALREGAGYTQEELATIAGLSVHAVSALERGERRRPHVDTVRALSAALDLTVATHDALVASARAPAVATTVDESSGELLPLPLTSLLGREADMLTLRQWLADPTARLITVLGPGGVGKTRLAVELGHAIADDGALRVVFVPLAAIRDPAFVASGIAEALGLAEVTADDLPRRVRVACENQPTLLLLDNFEHVLDAVPLVTSLLTSTASLRLLVTSRAPLGVRGEREYSLGPLSLEAGAEGRPPAEPAAAPAVQLFTERVRDVQPDFRLTSANGRAVMAICRKLDALPLALELAAPWIKVLTAHDLLERLERDVLFTITGPRGLPKRQQTMNAAVAWSYHLLSAGEQRAFRRFGALPGPFPIDAAAAVLAGRDGLSAGHDDALEGAAGLIEKSLLMRAERPAAGRPLYQMLETVRAYALLELTAAGERDDAMEGLVRYSANEAAVAAEGLVGPEQVDWLNRVRADLETYRGVLAWLIERGRHAEAASISWGLLFFWLIRGHAAEGLRWYEQTLNQPSLAPAAESRALLGAALMWWTQGDFEHARTAVSRALTLARDARDMGLVPLAEDLAARVEYALGHAHAAHDHFARSIEGFRALGISWGAGNSLIGMTAVVLATGDDDEAERMLEEATAVLQDAGPWFLARALFVRAIVAVRRARPDDAMALVRESLTRIRDLHDKNAFVYALVPLAAAALLKGDATWAARILGARDAVAEQTGYTMAVRLVHDLREQAEREARARLGPDRWARAYAAGRVSSIDSLIEDLDTALLGNARASHPG